MGFPINYLLQLLQSVTQNLLPAHGIGDKCPFPVALFKVCQNPPTHSLPQKTLQASPKPATSYDKSTSRQNQHQQPQQNQQKHQNGNSALSAMESPLTLDRLNLESNQLSPQVSPETLIPHISPRVLVYPTMVQESPRQPADASPVVEPEAAEGNVQRSMARRKKNEPPMDINKKCSYCDKVFKRPCDFTKHEKTHSRPWKCPVEDCKYFLAGWPTEKERDRHVNDRHSNNPPAYYCHFVPCTYTSKRESNLKQHMEKAHGWNYIRSKRNGKNGQTPTTASESSPQSATPQTPSLPLTPAMSTPISSLSTELPSPDSSHMPSPYNQNLTVSEPMIYQGSYMDGFATTTTGDNGQTFNFADPPLMSGYEYNDFQLFPTSSDLDHVSLDPVVSSNTDDFTTFNQTLDTHLTSEDLLSQPPSADMTLDQLGQDSLNPYCFDNEFYNYQTTGMAEFQSTSGMSDFPPTQGMPDFQSHNGVPEF